MKMTMVCITEVTWSKNSSITVTKEGGSRVFLFDNTPRPWYRS